MSERLHPPAILSPAERRMGDFGYKCPSCGEPKTSVRDSRPNVSGTISRKRRCNACGHRFGTVESSYNKSHFEIERLHRELAKQMDKAQSLLDAIMVEYSTTVEEKDDPE